MDEHDIRNMLLTELIDKMHGRLADKAFPDTAEPGVSGEDKPAVEDITPAAGEPESKADMSDEDKALEEELMKEHGV